MSRVVLVTGAGAGIGTGLCHAFAAAGDVVACTDRHPERAAAVAGAVCQATGRPDAAHGWALDIADVPAVRAVVADVVARLGGVDVAVCNAGITEFGRFLDYEPEELDRLLAVNLRGTWFTAQAVARHLVATGTPGRLVLMGSVTGERAIPGLAAYGSTKAALRLMTTGLAHELGPYGITVNMVSPGATLTERTERETPAYADDWAAVTPTGRVGQVGDVAAAVLFLASADAAQITGQTLVVDGGWTGASPLPPGY